MRRTVLLPIVATSLLVGTTVAAVAHDEQGKHREPQSVDVEPVLETRPTFDDEEGGYRASDDPTIWIHPEDATESLVLAAQKEGGLAAYDLDGELVQELAAQPAPGPGDEVGRINNIDVAYGFSVPGRGEVDIAVVSDRGLDQVRVYAIDPDADVPLTDISADALPWVFSSSQDEVNGEMTSYGLTTWQHFGRTDAFVTRNGQAEVAQVRLVARADGTVTYEHVRTIQLPSEFELPNGTTWAPCMDPGETAYAEGLVIDKARGVLYIGQETVGIWKARVWPFAGTPTLVDTVGEYGIPWTYDEDADEECTLHHDQDPGYGGDWLTADVEGLALYDGGWGRGYLIASSQGSDTFVLYDRGRGNDVVGELNLVEHDGIDAVGGTDGIDVTNVDLGGDFSDGLLVVQDEPNTPDEFDADGELRDNSNLKFVAWDDVADAFDSDLVVNTRPDPRRTR
jgi:3-phytase